jgi:hypothetical protein
VGWLSVDWCEGAGISARWGVVNNLILSMLGFDFQKIAEKEVLLANSALRGRLRGPGGYRHWGFC